MRGKVKREHIETKMDSIVFGQAFIGRMNEEGDMSWIKRDVNKMWESLKKM